MFRLTLISIGLPVNSDGKSLLTVILRLYSPLNPSLIVTTLIFSKSKNSGATSILWSLGTIVIYFWYFSSTTYLRKLYLVGFLMVCTILSNKSFALIGFLAISSASIAPAFIFKSNPQLLKIIILAYVVAPLFITALDFLIPPTYTEIAISP